MSVRIGTCVCVCALVYALIRIRVCVARDPGANAYVCRSSAVSL